MRLGIGLDDELVAVVDVMLDDVVGLAELEGRLVVVLDVTEVNELGADVGVFSELITELTDMVLFVVLVFTSTLVGNRSKDVVVLVVDVVDMVIVAPPELFTEELQVGYFESAEP